MKNDTDKLLVTYASRTGSTAETAWEIARVLAENGTLVDVTPMDFVADVASYAAVIAGSPIQGRQWLPEALRFVSRHRSELQTIPFATFTLCLTLAMKDGEQYRPLVREWLAPVRSLVRPVSEGLFAGMLDISRIPSAGDRLKFRLSVLFGVWKQGDHRDREAMRRWARELRDTLKSQAGQQQ